MDFMSISGFIVGFYLVDIGYTFYTYMKIAYDAFQAYINPNWTFGDHIKDVFVNNFTDEYGDFNGKMFIPFYNLFKASEAKAKFKKEFKNSN